MKKLSKQTKVIKVGVLGDKYVGKSYLCHKMTDRNYKGYQQTTQTFQFKGSESQQTTEFIYIDNPPLDNLSIINIGSVYQYDVLVFLFKDCESFTKLFEFFETIKQTLDSQQNHHVKQYWSQSKKIIVVYSNFQSVIEVKIQQLFTILIQQINQFCNKVIYQSFILKKQAQSWNDLKFSIQKQPINLYINQEVSDRGKQDKIPSLIKQQSYKQDKVSKLEGQGQKINKKQSLIIRKQKQLDPNLQRDSFIIQQNKQTTQKKDFRRNSIRYKIRQSFRDGQDTQHKLTNSNKTKEQNQLNKKQEIKKLSQNQNQNLFPSFRQTQGFADPKIDQQLTQYNNEKVQKLHNYVQISEDQGVKQINLKNSKQPVANPQNFKNKQQRKRPQSEFVSKDNKQQQARRQKQRCTCQIF